MRLLIVGMVCVALGLLSSELPGQASGQKEEMDVGRILWQSLANAEKYLGKPIKVLPPRIPAEGSEYQYRGGNGTIGTRDVVLLLLYRYKKRPNDVAGALRAVGLPTDTPPLDFGTSFVWPARGTTTRVLKLRGKTLNRVILAKDFSEITVDGHEPGTY